MVLLHGFHGNKCYRFKSGAIRTCTVNGERAEIPYSLWYNTGRQYNGYFTSEIDQFRGQITGSFDIVKRGSDTRNKHAISFGAEFSSSNAQFHSKPTRLLGYCSSAGKFHIQSLDESNPYVLVDGERVYYQDDNFPDLYFQDTIYFDRLVDTDAQSVLISDSANELVRQTMNLSMSLRYRLRLSHLTILSR